jgi:hypothetical protein
LKSSINVQEKKAITKSELKNLQILNGRTQMLTTFGPNHSNLPKFGSFTKIDLGNTGPLQKEESHAGNDDVEMTFGMIGSHNGNTSISNASLRTSH